MSLARHYLAIDNAEDSRAALNFVFLANGDSVFTAEKRIAECFFTRGRGRSLNTDLFSYATESIDEDEDLHVETKFIEETNKILNKYLESKMEIIEEEFASTGKVTKNIKSILLDLKVAYSLILSKSDLDGLSSLSLPDIDKPLWKELWEVDHLNILPLTNFSEDVVKPSERAESKLATMIRHRVRRDRYQVLDNLINYFTQIGRDDVVESIKVNEFQFINDTSTNISDKYKIELEGYQVINESRLQYISKIKIDLQYAQELIGIHASTYKKRSGNIKVELTELGEELKTGNLNSIQDYILN
jgi:hypothetical protein